MKMNLVKIVLLVQPIVLVVFCEMSSAEYYSNHTRDFQFLKGELESLGRQSRFLSFKTIDEDLKIALEFIVPFLSVPVKSTTDAASGMAKSMANINLAAIVLTGITVIAGVSAASGLTHLVKLIAGNKQFGKDSDTLNQINSFGKGYKKVNLDEDENPIGEVLNNIEAVFREYDVDISSCVQKTVCLLIKESAKKVSRGTGSSTNKIVDGLTGMNWLLRFLSGTAIKDAIDSGRSNLECRLKYQLCNWPDTEIMEFINNM